MARYIDADMLLRILETDEEYNKDNPQRVDGIIDAVQEIIAMPTADVPQWIPCSERLPYSQEDVLCDDDGRVTIGYYTDEEVGWHDTHSYRIYPTAWMPLPEPWKGEAE